METTADYTINLVEIDTLYQALKEESPRLRARDAAAQLSR
jgi:putative heme degradation protein